jgi:hypothetical protein
MTLRGAVRRPGMRATRLAADGEDRVTLDDVVKINISAESQPNCNDRFEGSLTDLTAHRIRLHKIFRTYANLRTAREHR